MGPRDSPIGANEAEGVASDQIARSAGSEALYTIDNATGTEQGECCDPPSCTV